MFDFDLIQCGLIVLLIMVAGEALSHRMKAIVPAILISGLIYLGLLWCDFLPNTLIQTSGLTHLTTLAMMFMIIGMGASTKPKDLLDNWRVVVLAAISYIGQTFIMIFVISLLFDRNTAIGGLPGGAAVALIVQEKARSLGHEQIILLSVLLLATQSLIACPLVSFMLRREITRYQHITIENDVTAIKSTLATTQSTPNEESPYWALLHFYVVAWIASRFEIICGISKYVFCLLLGILLTKLGFLHKDEMERSKSRGLIMLMMMTMVLNGFSAATPGMLLQLLKPLVCVFLIEVVSIFFISVFVGKLLGFSKEMSFAICLNVMIGFPLNLMLAQDIIKFFARSPAENDSLNQHIATKMVIAGFTSVTFLSTIVAGILVTFMQ